MTTLLAIRDAEAVARERERQALDLYLQDKGQAPIVYRSLVTKAKVDDEGAMTFVASEETEDRFGDLLSADGWQLEAFQENPVFLFAHNHAIPPIGRVEKIWIDGKKLMATVQWDSADPFAMAVKGKYERGFMRAVSVGFRALEFEERESQQPKGLRTIHFIKQELLEVSAVPIPAHPAALKKAFEGTGFSIFMPTEIPAELRGVIGWGSAHPNGTPKADRGADWDAGAEVRAASVEDLGIMCAWVDSDNADNKGAYKFPHHRAAGAHPVVFRALTAGIGVLNGGRGGANIPDSDRRGVYNHLARHMRDDFDAEPPELRAAPNMERMPKANGEMLTKIREAMGHMTKAMSMMEDMVRDEEEEQKKGENGASAIVERTDFTELLEAVRAFKGAA